MKTLELVTSPALAWRLIIAVTAAVVMIASGAGVSWGDTSPCWMCAVVAYDDGQEVYGCASHVSRGRVRCKVKASGTNVSCRTTGPLCESGVW